jgi:PAS domain S-box-containing protein
MNPTPGPPFEPVPAVGLPGALGGPGGRGGLGGLTPPDLPLLALLLEHMPGGVVVFDRSYCCLFANAAALKAAGLSAAQAGGRPVAELLGQAAWRGVQTVADRVFSGEAMRREGWIDDPQFGRRYLEELFLPYAPGGVVQAVIGHGRDLTAQRLSEQRSAERRLALERAERLKASIVDNALSAIVTADADGVIVEFNPAAQAMFGLSRTQAVGRTVADVMVPERHRADHNAGMRRMAQGAEPRAMGRPLAMHAMRADGSEFPMQMVLWTTQVAGATYYTATLHDVSEQVRTAEVIERQRDALRQSEKLGAMGSLLAGVAHELNNPLAIVMGRASLLEEKCAGTPLHHDTQRILEAAERCGRIVRTFLNMARQRPAERKPVALNDLVQGAAEMLQYSLRASGVALTLDLARDLPETLVDGDRLGQVVLNLIVNAQQALGAVRGPRELHIRTGQLAAADGQGVTLWLQVADNGPGVPDAVRARIFDPYFTTKGEGVGTGLGLAVSRAVARDHGGELDLDPGPGGASFRLTLPVEQAPAPAVPPAAASEPPAGDAQRVLVVDDEPEIAGLLRTLLEGAGYDVATAESGAVALEMLGEVRFDAIVSDLRMPDVDGAALWRELNAHHPAMARRLLFVTGDALSPGARRFVADSGCASLDKPFSRADLLTQVQALIRGG